MKRNWWHATLARGVVTLLAMLGTAAGEATAQEPREVRLGVDLTPDAPDLSDDRSLGLGALYWAVHHPRRAWQILLPIQTGVAAPEVPLKEIAPGHPASRVGGPPVG